jgi:hypothetical protein
VGGGRIKNVSRYFRKKRNKIKSLRERRKVGVAT